MRYSLILVSTLALAAAVPAPSSYVVHEKRDRPLQVWAKRNAVPGDFVLPMRIGLKQSNLDKGHDLLMDISHHESPNYGKHYTAEEVNDLFAPEKESVEAVRAWLESAGIDADRITLSANKAWLQFDARTHEAEDLLRTKYHFFEHSENGDANIACDKYHVPSQVHSHIDYITPGLKLLSNGGGSKKENGAELKKRGFAAPGGRPQPPRTKPLPMPLSDVVNADPLSTCDQIVTPACVKALYNITKGDKANPNNKLGIFESSDVYSQNNLNLFFGLFAQDIPNGTHPELRSVDGGLAPVERVNFTYYGGESDLDFELAYPIVWPQNTVLFQADDLYYSNFQNGNFFQGLFNTFLDAIDGSYCTFSYNGETGDNPAYDPTYPDTHPGGYNHSLQCGVYKPTNVVSISYGINEYDISLKYQERQCQEFMKLGLQGTSVVVASGDSGVAGRPGQNGHNFGCLGKNSTIFNPDFPGTCPYLTMVGSTTLPRGASAAKDAEISTTEFGSGGGFSNLYPRPSWQKQAVDDYLTKYAPAFVKNLPYYSTSQNKSVGANGGVYNRAGRAYPDVSAVGQNIFVVADRGEPTLSAGTSASAPIFASILNRINEERIAAGKSTIGFVNPTLYAHPEMFHDITSGNNTACQNPNGSGQRTGFVAAQGWDPVSGLGTPNYPAMLKVFMGLK